MNVPGLDPIITGVATGGRPWAKAGGLSSAMTAGESQPGTEHGRPAVAEDLALAEVWQQPPAWEASPWVVLIPAMLALGFGLWGLGSHPFSRDEGATVLAVSRTYPQLVRMLGNIDVVHGGYYSLMWVITQIGGTSELAVRLPSAVAVAAAAGTLAALGRQLAGAMAGLAAGLVFAVLPTMSYYGQLGREYAFVIALATLASYLLVRAIDDFPGRRRWLAAYAVTLMALGLANLSGLLLIPAHALSLAAMARRGRGRVQRFMAGWLTACGAAVLAVTPVMLAGDRQIHQIHWVKAPGLEQVIGVTGLIGPLYLFGAVAAITVTAAIAGAGRVIHQPGPARPVWPAKLRALAVPWLLLPPAVLLTISLIHPVYAFRYIAFCLPAAALLIGTALASSGRTVAAAGLAIIMLAGLPAQLALRSPAVHKVNVQLADQVVAHYAQAGDALLTYSRTGGTNERGLAGIYPFGLGRLRDISQGESPGQSATLGGTYAATGVERQRLARVTRLWIASWKPGPVPILGSFRVRLLRAWHVGGVYLRLYLIGGQHYHHRGYWRPGDGTGAGDRVIH